MVTHRSDEAAGQSLVPDIRQHEANLLADIEQAKKHAELSIEQATVAAHARLEAAKKALPDILATRHAQGQAEIQGLVDRELDNERRHRDHIAATAKANMDRAVERIVQAVVPRAAP